MDGKKVAKVKKAKKLAVASVEKRSLKKKKLEVNLFFSTFLFTYPIKSATIRVIKVATFQKSSSDNVEPAKKKVKLVKKKKLKVVEEALPKKQLFDEEEDDDEAISFDYDN